MDGQIARKKFPAEVLVAPFSQFRSKLTIREDLIFEGERLVIPHAFRREMKTKLYHGHPGIERCRARARRIMFWLGMNAELTELVSNCGACIENPTRAPDEPQSTFETMTKSGMAFNSKEKNYLV